MLVTETSTRLQQAPTSVGSPIGSGDWELHVERLVGDPDAAFWDIDVWDTGLWSSLEWESLNDVLRGMEWTRGADQPNGRPINGEISLTLFNDTAGTFDPWVNYPNTRPGTIIRAGLTSATDIRADGWIPLWTGLVESWNVVYLGARDTGTDAARGDSFAEVMLVETLSWLARIDDNSTAAVGSGDTVSDRVDRLLTAAAWPFGMVELYSASEGESTIVVQSTTMAANRLTEVYLTADSTLSVVMSDATGACLVTDWKLDKASRLYDFSHSGTSPLFTLRSNDHTVLGSVYLDYVADTLQTANDPTGIVNDHRYARVGGSQQVFEHDISIGAFGRSTRARSDLITTTDGNVLVVAEADNIREALTALRVDGVEVVATGREMALLICAAADWGDSAAFYPPPGSRVTGSGSGRIRSITHQVSPLTSDSVNWTATFAIDFYAFSNVAGAILPAA